MDNMVKKIYTIFVLAVISNAYAAKSVTIELINPKGKPTPIGTLTLDDTSYGLLITPNLKGLPSGIHGFHIHEHPSCDQAGMAAGGHFDPGKTNKHQGPYDDFGHQGDMPVLIVDSEGNATLPLLAPRLREFETEGRAVMIHAGGDNYSDKPKKLGGGGDRIACGVVK